jgi:hypothetical protein
MKSRKRGSRRGIVSEEEKDEIIQKFGQISFPKRRPDAKRLKKKAERELKGFENELARKRLEARKQGLEIFAADFLEELRERLRRSHRDQPVPDRSVKRLVPFLPYFDWRLAGIVPPVRNQDTCNACWAYTATEVFESRLMYNLNRFKIAVVGSKRVRLTRVAISVQSVLDCVSKGECIGGWHGDAFNYFVERGAPVRKLDTSRIDDSRDAIGKKRRCRAHQTAATRAVAWCFVSDQPDEVPSVRRLKEALLEHGPLIVLVTPDQEFLDYGRDGPGGIFPQSRTKAKDNPFPTHTVLLTGWHDEKKAWIIQNQFGENWGISCITKESTRIRPLIAKRLKRHGGCMFIRWGSHDVGKFASWIEAPFDVRFAES